MHEKTNNLVFLTRSDTNWPVQSQEQARTLKFQIKEEEVLHCLWSENKGTDQPCSYCTADLGLCFRICRVLVFLCSGSIISYLNIILLNHYLNKVKPIKNREINASIAI